MFELQVSTAYLSLHCYRTYVELAVASAWGWAVAFGKATTVRPIPFQQREEK